MGLQRLRGPLHLRGYRGNSLEQLLPRLRAARPDHPERHVFIQSLRLCFLSFLLPRHFHGRLLPELFSSLRDRKFVEELRELRRSSKCFQDLLRFPGGVRGII